MSPHLASLVAFCFVMAATPGPNNMMVMASGARWGMRRTFPHLLGVAIGFPAMLALIGAGLGAPIRTSEAVRAALESIAILATLWIAGRIATAGAPHEVAKKSPRPLRFFEAALFQWINPKAWAIGFVAVTLYAHGHGAFWANLGCICGIFILITMLCLSAWAALGRGAARLLPTERHFRLFNTVMAGLLIVAMVPLAWGG
ncbi:MAG: LysE family translocator [Acetobacteraceae bacterium]